MCSCLSHPCILHYHGVCFAPPRVNLVFELCELGSLYDVIPVHGKVRLVHAAVRRSPHCVSWMLRMHVGLGLGTAPPHGTVWG